MYICLVTLNRKGKYKLIHGIIRDPNWYSESKYDGMNTTDTGMIVKLLENMSRFFDWTLGQVENDMFRMYITNILLFQIYSKREGYQTLLFDVDKDPRETKNIASDFPHILKDMIHDIEMYKLQIPKATPYWMVSDDWHGTFISGIQ